MIWKEWKINENYQSVKLANRKKSEKTAVRAKWKEPVKMIV